LSTKLHVKTNNKNVSGNYRQSVLSIKIHIKPKF
jgi:hypothetical protein